MTERRQRSATRAARWKATCRERQHRVRSGRRLTAARAAVALGEQWERRYWEARREAAQARVNGLEEATHAWREARQLLDNSRDAERWAGVFAGVVAGVALSALLALIVNAASGGFS